MLGLGRASEYAGWWSGGAINISIPVATTVSQAAYQTPSFSWLTINSPQNANQYSLDGYYPSGNYGTVDLTGYTALSGFNDRRATMMYSIYLDWPPGSPDDYYGQQTWNWQVSSSDLAYFYNAWNIASGSVRLNYGGIAGAGNYNASVTLPGAYTDYTSKWITVVMSSAETSSVFANWNGTGSGNTYYRIAFYDTAAGTLIKKQDTIATNGPFPSISSMGNTVPVASSASTAQTNWNIIKGGTAGVDFSTANWWGSAGTMWDPETAKATDTTWLTTRPNSTIGTGRAWVNVPYASLTNNNNILYQGIKQSGTDLYTQANSVVMVGSTTSTSWNAVTVAQSQNTTNIPKDTS